MQMSDARMAPGTPPCMMRDVQSEVIVVSSRYELQGKHSYADRLVAWQCNELYV